MYKHKFISPLETGLIKYRGNTGQIDVKSSIITILSKYPGSTGMQVAERIYDKKLFPLSISNVYKTLKLMVSRGELQRNDNLYFLTADAISHDMAVTVNVAERLKKSGVDLEQAGFLSSAVIMAGEKHVAEAQGEEYDMQKTEAVNLASQPVEKKEDETEFSDTVVPFYDIQRSSYGVDDIEDWLDNTSLEYTYDASDSLVIFGDSSLLKEFLYEFDFEVKVNEGSENIVSLIEDKIEMDSAIDEVINPFTDMSDTVRTELKTEVSESLKDEKRAEEEAEAKAIIEAEDAAYRNKLNNIKSAQDLLGLDVQLHLSDIEGEVVATILELRSTGITFMVTFSTCDNYTEGSVLPIEYSQGVRYTIK